LSMPEVLAPFVGLSSAFDLTFGASPPAGRHLPALLSQGARVEDTAYLR
jgi:hypothetical protein